MAVHRDRTFTVASSVVALLLGWGAWAAAEDGAAEVSIDVDAAKVVGPISPLVYGINGNNWDKRPHITFSRSGGNRMTAYNWENNASSAGNDWHHQNDAFLGGGETPGEVIRSFVAPALQRGKTVIVTVPMAGYVAADKKGGGDVNQTPDYLQTRFARSLPKKSAPFVYPPDLNDQAVYQDEFVWWLNRQFPASQRNEGRIFYSLDNEPDIWASTHARIHPEKVTYAEMVDKTRDLAGAIKDVDPQAVVFGFVSYGYAGYMHLQNAPDANGRDFISFFLDSLRELEKQQGRRLVDVLDLHWYPEARGGGKRVTERDSQPEVCRARVQAPRSLWDPSYQEDSWITNNVLHKPICLIPTVQQKIAQHYPGTKLAFTEYDYGGGEHISGGIAQADVLGIFGREGVFAASLWGGGSFIHAGFDCYRNYDGAGGAFGDQALHAASSKVEDVSVYASRSENDPGKLVMVLINRAEQPRVCQVNVTSFPFAAVQLYRLSGEEPKVKPAGTVPTQGGRAMLTLPAMTVTTAVLSR